MKNPFPALPLALAAICAGLLCQSPLRAQNPEATAVWSFYPTGSITTWTVPQAGNYMITAYGAQGGGSFAIDTPASPYPGGLGAIIGGTIQLSANHTLNILVGLMGGNVSSYAGGGGGGSFVVNSDPYNNTPLVVAGGGGGMGVAWSQPPLYGPTINATISTSGNPSFGGTPGGFGQEGGYSDSNFGSGPSGGGGGGLEGDGEPSGYV